MMQEPRPRETLRWWIFGGVLFGASYVVRSWLSTRHAGGHPGSFSWLAILAPAGFTAAAIAVLFLISRMLRSLKRDKELPPIRSYPSTSGYPCPSCGFLVFAEPPGSFDICEICGWEDDVVQLLAPTYEGGANSDSLATSQAGILKTLPIEIREHKGFRRDPQWRPLRDEDLKERSNAGSDYYWLRDEKL